MKFTPSAIVSALSGSAAGLTAATWKGTGYFRTRVTPANPQSVAQTAQRNALAACVACYQSLAEALKTFLDLLGNDAGYSGFNKYIAGNVAEERADYGHDIMPANRYAETLQNFAAVTGVGASGTIDVTWDAGSYVAGDLPLIFTRKVTGVATVFETPWTIFDVGAVEMDDEALTITGLTPDTAYQVAMFPYNAVTGYYGGGDHDEVDSKA